MNIEHGVLLAALVSTGLACGFFYAWQVSVIPGTMQTDDRSYVQTMQHINVRIINPGFFIPFLVTPLLLVAAAVLAQRSGNSRRAATLASAAVLYTIGVVGVTAGGNVPLNNTLAEFDLSTMHATELAAARSAYEGPWNRWHLVRTIASVIALAVAAAAPLVSIEEG